MAVVAQGVVELIPSAKGFSSKLQREIGGDLAKVGDKQGKSLGGKVAAGFGVAAKAGFAGAGALAAGALTKGFGRLKSIDDAEGKLKGLGHSSKTVDGIMKNALGSVKGTAFGLDEAATTAAGSVAAGIKPGKELEDTLSLVADAATIGGTSMSEMGGIFNKVASSNKVQGDVINQLNERGIPIVQMLAKEMGVTEEEVYALSEAGKIGFDDFRNAMESGLGGAAQESGKTFSGAMANAGAALGRLGASFLSGVFPQMKTGLNELTGLFDRMGPTVEAWGAKLGAGIRVAAGGIGSFISNFREGEGAAGRFRDVLSTLWSAVRDAGAAAFQALLPHLKIFVADMVALAPTVLAVGRALWDFLVAAFKAVLPYLKMAALVIGGVLVGAMKILPPYLKVAATNFMLVLSAVKPLLPVLAAGAAAFVLYRGVMMAAGLAMKAYAAITKMVTVVTRIFNAVVRANPLGLLVTAIMLAVGALVYLYRNNDTARRIMNAAWASIKVAISGVTTWFTKVAWPAMRAAFQGIAAVAMWLYRNAILPAWRGIKLAVSATVSWVRNTAWPWMRAAFQGIARVAMWLYRNAILPAWRGIRSAVSAVVSWVRGTAWPWMRSAFQGIARVAKWLYRNAILPAWRGIKASISVVVSWIREKAWPWIRNAFNSIAGRAKWLYGRVRYYWNLLQAAISKVTDFIRQQIVSRIRNAFGRIQERASWLRNKVRYYWNLLQAAISKVTDFIRQQIVSRIRSAFGRISDRASWLRSKVRDAWNRMQAAISKVTDFIRQQIVSRIRNAFGRIKDGAEWMRDKIRAAFDRVKQFATDMQDHILKVRDGIREGWSKITGYITSPLKKALGWMQRNFISKLRGFIDGIPGVTQFIPNIPGVEGWARGGILPGYTSMGRGDDVLTPMRSGEGVMVSEGLRDRRSRSMFLAANEAAKRGTSFADFMGHGFAKGGIVALGKKIQKKGYHVSEHPAFGGVARGAHSPNGYHYKGGALDINADPWLTKFKSEAPALDKLNRWLRGMGWNTIWRAPNHYDHLHVDIGKGGKAGGGGGGGFSLPDWAANPLKWAKDKVAAATSGFKSKAESFGYAGKVFPAVFDKVQGAVEKQLEKAAELLDFGGGPGMDVSGLAKGPVVAQVQKVAKKYGWGSGPQWEAIKWIVNKESSWNPKAANPTSSARGLFQKMTHIHGPVEKTAAGQANWGLNYIRCVPLDTEILTRRGWLAHDEVQVGDETIGYDPATGAAVWTRITHVHHYEDAPVTHLSNSRWESRSTPNHRWVTEKYQQRVGDYGFRQEMTQTQHLGTRHRLVLAAPHESDTKLDITPKEAELLGWVMGDGSIYYGRNNRGGKRGKLGMSVAQTKPKYMAELRECLSEIPHSEYVTRPNHWSTNEGASFRLRSDFARDLLERSGYERDPEAMVLGMSQEQREAFFRGFMFADGHVPTSGASPMFSQNEGWKLDVALLTMYLLGHYGNPTDSAGHKHVTVGKATVKADFREEVLERQAVWCVTTEADTWTMRQGGRVMLTGNSRYGTPTKAQAFWRRNNWYDQGGIAAGKGFMQKKTLQPERVLSPRQTVAFEDWMRAKPVPAPASSGVAALVDGQVVTVNVIDRDGTFVDRMRGEIDADRRNSERLGRRGR